MKDFLEYYNASDKNKVKVIVVAILIYFSLYFASHPYILQRKILKLEIFYNDAVTKVMELKNKGDAVSTSPVPTAKPSPLPTSVPGVESKKDVDYQVSK